MRALLAAVIVMGVLIVAGTATLLVLIAHRMSGAIHAPPSEVNATLELGEPEGTHISGIAAAGDRVVLYLSGGGADRLVLIDPHRNEVVGRVAIVR